MKGPKRKIGTENSKNKENPREQDTVKRTGNSGSGKCLNLSSNMPSVFFTDCGMSQVYIPGIIGLRNQ